MTKEEVLKMSWDKLKEYWRASSLDNLSDCFNCYRCSNCSHCSDCSYCSGCYYCFSCFNCSDCSYCSCCWNVTGVRYAICNVVLTEEEYRKKIEDL